MTIYSICYAICMSEPLKFSAASTGPEIAITVVPDTNTYNSFYASVEPPLPDGGIGVCEALNRKHRAAPPASHLQTFAYAANAQPVHSDEAGTIIAFNAPIEEHESGTHRTRVESAVHRVGAAMSYLIDPTGKRDIDIKVSTKTAPEY